MRGPDQIHHSEFRGHIYARHTRPAFVPTPGPAFSSGCIRLERPMELLDAVLQGLAGWDRPGLRGCSSRVHQQGRRPALSGALHHTPRWSRTASPHPAGYLRAGRGLCAGAQRWERRAAARAPGRQPPPGCREDAAAATALPLLRGRSARSRPAAACDRCGLGLAAGGLACPAAGPAALPRPWRRATPALIERVQTGESFDGTYWNGKVGTTGKPCGSSTGCSAIPRWRRHADGPPALPTCSRASRRRLDAAGDPTRSQRLPGAGDQCGARPTRSRRVPRASLAMSGMAADYGCRAGIPSAWRGWRRSCRSAGSALTARRLRPPGLRPRRRW